MKTTRWTWVVAVLAVSGCGRDVLLTSVVPGVARSGEEVVVSGSGFGSQEGRVTFDDAVAPVVAWGPEEVRVLVPMQTHPEVTLRLEPREGPAVTMPFTIYDAMVNADGSAGAAKTFVSITFDDSTADQLAVRPTLAATGIRATFYVNSTRLGSAAPDLPAYMTLDQALSLQAEGHEIGGHTKHHVDLTLLDPEETVRQVCGDREQLRSLGLNPQTFAWPFGRRTEALSRVVEGCGYSAARSINHEGAPWPLLVPVPNRFALPAAIAVTATTTLARLQTVVTNGEADGGRSWVVIVIHRVCDNACSSTAIAPALFDQFATWLAARQSSGTVTRTVRQLMGDGVAPTLAAVVAAPRTTDNLLRNPSLESFSSQTLNPDCWLLADTGHQLGHWTRVTPGHEGAWALQLSAGEPVTANRRMKMIQDDGSCSPPVVAGARYEFSAWYQSSVPLRFNSFLRDEQGFWKPWELSPIIPASPGQWTRGTWQLAEIPPMGRALALSVRLQSEDGTMTLDDFSLARINP